MKLIVALFVFVAAIETLPKVAERGNQQAIDAAAPQMQDDDIGVAREALGCVLILSRLASQV